MKLYQIKSRLNSNILFELKCNSMKECIEGADLQDADLRYAYLRNADLQEADLQEADLRYANLRYADLRGAYLRYANLENANLQSANLRNTDLRDANLQGANLRGADLRGADLPHFKITPEVGGFYAWKKTTNGIIKIYIPANAKRINSLIGRKCRASKVKVISGPGCSGKSPTHGKAVYNKGEIIHADSFDSDIRVECTNGIHFFMTKQEAEEWN